MTKRAIYVAQRRDPRAGDSPLGRRGSRFAVAYLRVVAKLRKTLMPYREIRRRNQANACLLRDCKQRIQDGS
jgi:hypothetical protein